MNLIVFFNGWGMGDEVISKIKIPENYKVISLSFPYDLDIKILKDFNEIIFIGWSFGIYYLSKFLANNEIKYSQVIAINGTPEVIGKNGIGERVFDLTLRNMNEENLKKFYENINFISDDIHNKNIISLIEELKFLRNNYTPQKNFISKAIIGKEDKTILYKNQKRYYKEKGTKIIEISASHYPFDYFDSWEKIINISEV